MTLPDWSKPRTVSGLAAVFGLIFALGSVAIGAALYAVAGIAFNRVQDARIERERGRLLALVAGHAPDTNQIAERIRTRIRTREISSIGHRLVDDHGRIVLGTMEIRTPPDGVSGIVYRQLGEEWEAARAVEIKLADGGRLTIISESESVEDMGKIVGPLFGTAVTLAAVMGVFTSLLLGRLIAARLAAIGTTADEITAGDYSRRVPIDSLGGTFARQARTFNRMLDRIELLMGDLRQVSSNIAHDLRTPLTRLQVILRDAAAEDLDTERRIALIAAADRESDNILSLFAALLRIGEIQTGRRRPHVAVIKVDLLVQDIVETYAPAFVDAGRHLEFAGHQPCSIRGDADLFNQLLVNLVENALVHTPEGSSTWVCLECDVGVTLIVRDDGVGIPAEQREEAMRRFARLDRSRNTPGHGLGLALVVAIARFHDAEVTLDDAAPGLIVRVRFPAVETSATF